MGLVLPFRRPLVYPGTAPGFDQSHLAAASPRVSVVASGADFIALQPSSTSGPWVSQGFSGLPTGPIIGIGPSLLCTTIGGHFAFAAATTPFTTSPDLCTFAAIFQLRTTGAEQGLFSDNENGGNEGRAIVIKSSGSLTILSIGHDWDSGIVLSPNVPYFIIASQNSITASGNNIYYLVLNLNTGAIRTAGVVANSPGAIFKFHYYIGVKSTNFGFFPEFANSTLDGYVAAVMYSAAYLTLPQMRQWANDPWAFWYPRPLDLSMMFGGTPPITPPVVTPPPGIFARAEW